MISFAVTAKLICVFVFAYAKCWFSHDVAHLSSQTVQTNISLLLEEQSDQGPHCLPSNLHLSDKFPYGNTSMFEIYGDSKYFGCPKLSTLR